MTEHTSHQHKHWSIKKGGGDWMADRSVNLTSPPVYAGGVKMVAGGGQGRPFF